MTREELLDLVYSQREDGIRITFAGKDVAKRIARKVQPRTSRRLAKYSAGTEEEQARNLVIEGENLQAMVTLHRERGKVDLILADPPASTMPLAGDGTASPTGDPDNVTAKRRNLAGRAADSLRDARQATGRAVCLSAATRRDLSAICP
jgi:hypothetical protein